MPHTIPARRSVLRGAALATVLAVTALAGSGCAPRVDTVPVAVVFFEDNSAALNPAARGVVREFAADATKAPLAPVVVRGYADPSNATPSAVSIMSAQRVKAVSDALVAQGIAANRVTQRPRGASKLDPGVESRRVEIELVR